MDFAQMHAAKTCVHSSAVRNRFGQSRPLQSQPDIGAHSLPVQTTPSTVWQAPTAAASMPVQSGGQITALQPPPSGTHVLQLALQHDRSSVHRTRPQRWGSMPASAQTGGAQGSLQAGAFGGGSRRVVGEGFSDEGPSGLGVDVRGESGELGIDGERLVLVVGGTAQVESDAARAGGSVAETGAWAAASQ